jgi:3-oxoacyl-[acyl-carrier protein] reductase
VNLNLINKRALVCGSTQGIGKAVALELASMGASVVLVARDANKLQIVMNELPTAHNQTHEFIAVDFSDYNAVKTAIEGYLTGGNLIDILINNTGGPKGGPIIDADITELITTFNQHLICNHLLVQALVPGMKTLGGGSIVNIISTSVKQPLPGLGVSNTIRGAVASWSKSLANELGGFNIRVNNVLPGATNTIRLQGIAEAKSEKTGEQVADIFSDMAKESPMKRIAEAEEIAAAVAFLVSPAASYINGINVPVDGGRTKSL